MSDDREEFARSRATQSLALGRDQDVFQHALETLVALDKYDYSYLWSWMGVPIIQLPADVMATQEVIWATKPDVIIETGVARGGSVIFMASLLEAIGKGRVIGVDVDIRPHNRESIEQHPMYRRIELIEGSSTSSATLETIRKSISTDEKVMVVLDSDHSRDHVLDELRAYAPMVTEGCYLVVADTILGKMDAHMTPKKRSKVWLRGDEPLSALNTFLEETDEFEQDAELNGKLAMSSSPGGYIRKLSK